VKGFYDNGNQIFSIVQGVSRTVFKVCKNVFKVCKNRARNVLLKGMYVTVSCSPCICGRRIPFLSGSHSIDKAILCT